MKKGTLNARTSGGSKRLAIYAVVVLCLAAVSLLAGLILTGSEDLLTQRLRNEGWGPRSATMARYTAQAVLHMSAIVAVAGFLFLCGAMGWLKRFPGAWKFALVVILALDLLIIGRKFVSIHDARARFASNPLVEKLQQDTEPFRLAMLGMNEIYDDLAGTSLAVGGIQHLDMFANWRMPGDEMKFMTALQENQLRIWELCNARYILSDAEAGFALVKDPQFSGMFEPIFAFNIAMMRDHLVILRPNNAHPPQHLLLKFNKALPRAALYRHWEVIPSEADMLKRLADKTFNPATTALLSEAPGGALAGATNAATAIVACEVVSSKTVRVEVRVPALDSPGLLVLSDKHHPAWEVTVDGNQAELLRCNYLMRGVGLPAGAQEVVFEYRPSTTYVKIGLVSTALILLWGAVSLAWALGQRSGPRRASAGG